MTILVTGGASFIGSNLVLDWMAQSDEPVVNLHKLTYAGNLGNLASLQGHVFVRGDLGDRSPVDHLLAKHKPPAVPEGFAHGFVVLSDRADFLYKTTYPLLTSAASSGTTPHDVCIDGDGSPSSPPRMPKAERLLRPRCLPDA